MAMRITGLEISTKTLLYAEPEAALGDALPRPATATELERDLPVRLDFACPEAEWGELSFFVGAEDARRLAGWLEEAGRRATSGGSAEAIAEAAGPLLTKGRRALVGEHRGPWGEDDRPEYTVDLVEDGRARVAFHYDDEGDAVLLPRGEALELAAALGIAVEALEATPPRVLPDLGVAQATGLTSARVLTTLDVVVRQGVQDATEPRLTFSFLGTWALDGDTSSRLAEALAAAAAAVEAGLEPRSLLELTEGSTFSGARPWLAVRTSRALGPGRGVVELTLTDEIVEENGDDGVLLLPACEALRLARALGAAHRHIAEHRPYVFVPPEPLAREVAAATWPPA